MHYAFDRWMDREHPECPFERYADDMVVHCVNKRQAKDLLTAIADRLGTLGLELHPGKTRLVYCKDDRRRGSHEHTSFDFLGFGFRARSVLSRHRFFVGFNPAMSDTAMKAVGKKVRDWHLKSRSASDLSDLAREINPHVRGWINYYGAFYRSRLQLLARRIDEHIVRWAMRKFKRLRHQPVKAWAWLNVVKRRSAGLFAHWHMLPAADRRLVGAV